MKRYKQAAGGENINGETSKIQQRARKRATPNIQHPTSNIQHPTSNIQHPMAPHHAHGEVLIFVRGTLQ